MEKKFKNKWSLDVKGSTSLIKAFTEEAYDAQFKLKPEIGKWYTLKDSPENNVFYVTSVDETGTSYGYGFDDGVWFNNQEQISTNCACNEVAFQSRARLATEKEVKNALINEAKKRYPIGTYLTCLRNWHKDQKLYSNQNKFDLEDKHNQLWEKSAYMRYCVFQNGKWAEIVPNEVKVNGYIVTKINDSSVKVGCKQFDIKWLDGLYNFIYYYDGEYIASDGSKWTGSDISKIINAFNKM